MIDLRNQVRIGCFCVQGGGQPHSALLWPNGCPVFVMLGNRTWRRCPLTLVIIAVVLVAIAVLLTVVAWKSLDLPLI